MSADLGGDNKDGVPASAAGPSAGSPGADGPPKEAGPRGARRAPRGGRGGPPLAARRPVVVWVLAWLNVAVGAFLAGRGSEFEFEVLESLGHNRLAVWDGELWRLGTSVFLHAGFLHLALNVLALLYIGRAVERWFGHGRTLWAYLLSGAGGVVFYQAFSGLGTGVGASGAILGLFGILLVARMGRPSPEGVVLGLRFWCWAAAVVVLLFLEEQIAGLFFQSMTGARIQVALSAHYGGFFAGLILGYLYLCPAGSIGRRRRWAARLALGAFFVVTSAYGFVAPVGDWTWYFWRAGGIPPGGNQAERDSLYARARALGGDAATAAILIRELEEGRLAEALDHWREWEFEDPAVKRHIGYLEVYDRLAASDLHEPESLGVLDALIESADEALEVERTPENLNEAAWYRALRVTDLQGARELAVAAVNEDPNGEYFNTLGWVQFLLGEYQPPATGPAFENLKQAVHLRPVGANFLYLALAYYRARDLGNARVEARRAGRVGGLLRHEEKLLEWLEASLASG